MDTLRIAKHISDGVNTPRSVRAITRAAAMIGAICVTASGCAAPKSSLPERSWPAAPWSGETVRQLEIPAVYHEQWRVAANRTSCSLVALTKFGAHASAVPRAATFSGGWAVAYDLPQLRSAFGIAGTGSRASDPSYSDWPDQLRWSDGSTAGYGPEGGSGPNQLAYLRIANEECLFNVWSRISREHLELLLEGIRRVETAD